MRVKILILLFSTSIKILGLDITGFIVNTQGESIDNVIISANNKAVISNNKGQFKIFNVQHEDKVTFHKISFKDRTLKASDIKERVVLEDDIITIQGLRIIEQRKRELIGSKEITIIESGNNSGSAADILRENTGLQISGVPLTGEEQMIIFPGYKARHTLVMLDGIPLNKSGTAFDISTIPAEIIESIEVMKGSSSSVGGAGSMGGIININTKRATHKYKISINHSFGSFGLDKHSFTISAANSKIQLFALIRKSFARNDFKYVPADDPDTLRTREYNKKSIYDANISMGYSGAFGMLSYKLLFQVFFKKLPGNIESLEEYKNSRLTGQSQKHIVNYSKKIEDYRLKADLHYSLNKSLYDNTRLDLPWSENIYLATLAKNRQLSRGIKLHTEYLSDIFFIDWGGDYRYEDFRYTDLNYPTQTIERVFRENYAVFGKAHLKQKYFPYTSSLIGSVRWDNTTDFNDHTSWKLEPEFTYENYFLIYFGGNVANGYSLPSYYSLFWKGDSHVSGNPELKPESSLSWQVFSKLEILENFIKVTYRHENVDDLIIWDINSFGKWMPRNLSSAEVENWDFELSLNPYKFLRLRAVYTKSTAIIKSKDDPTYGNKIIYTPDYSLDTTLKIKVKKFQGTINYKLTGEQWSNSFQATPDHQLPAYDLLNASSEYSFEWIDFKFTPAIRINNILNKLYEVYDHVPQPGFNWEINLGLEYKL